MHRRSLAYEASEMLLLHPATDWESLFRAYPQYHPPMYPRPIVRPDSASPARSMVARADTIPGGGSGF